MLPAELIDVALYASMPRYGDLCTHAIVDVRRTFSRAELERAVEATLRDFPVLGCRYQPRLWRDAWLRVDAPISTAVHVVDQPGDLEAATATWVRRSIDPTRERQLRLVSLGRGRGSRLILSVMHLAVDGGGLAAVGHVLGSHLYERTPRLPVDPRRDLARALDGLRWEHLPLLARDLAATLVQPLRTFAAAERERHFAAAPSSELRWRHVVLSADELVRLKSRCPGASVNDLLIAALARVSAARSSAGPVTVLYTMDLRRYGAGPRLTAANTSSIVTAIVPRAAVADLPTTAREVAAITAGHRSGLIGPAFVLAPYALALGAPHGLLRRLLPLVHPVAVDLPLSRGLLVTNVGRIDDGLDAFGDDVEDIQVVGPNIQGVPTPAVVAFGFRGRLHLELLAPAGLAGEVLADLERELRAALELPPGARAARQNDSA